MIDDSRELKSTVAFHQSTDRDNFVIVTPRTKLRVARLMAATTEKRKTEEKSNKNRVGTGARWSNVDRFDYSRDTVVPNVIRTWNRIRRIYDGCFDRRVNLPRSSMQLYTIFDFVGKLTILCTATALKFFLSFFYSNLIRYYNFISVHCYGFCLSGIRVQKSIFCNKNLKMNKLEMASSK